MATFPTAPFLLFDDFEVNRNSAVRRTEMERGPSKQHRRTTRAIVERKVTYGFRTLAEYLSFIDWFKVTINYGASWFEWTDPVTNTPKTARIKDGQLLREKPVDIMATKWDVSFVLEVWDS